MNMIKENSIFKLNLKNQIIHGTWKEGIKNKIMILNLLLMMSIYKKNKVKRPQQKIVKIVNLKLNLEKANLRLELAILIV